MQAHILVIEDNSDIAQVIQYELQEGGWSVATAPNGITGLLRARETPPHLVILDLGLPDFDGAEVARRLRKTTHVPIIVLTAIDAVDRKVELLEAGANDYVTKPFHPEELLARVKVQLRQKSDDLLSFGALQIRPERRQVIFEGKEVHLSPKEFELLLLLSRQPGRVYSREEITSEIWRGELSSTSNVVDVHFGNLRRKLRNVAGRSSIRTVRGRGYALRSPA
ncbi:response regulator transcription factor [Deinococcus hopiensis]|uniref:DNA-binding response regulator, OmpR family, contains REC and winged-helix (WHTH) domain n=1 Tax=Deinococcus hopiensis KR-140 TaxID=695939 RepID=A0A1W1UBQ5_9DEIO|nr:response regulator transcription factor [Deinococcus hopiensis]SMB78470.1 DNA-binding response regulator, OmpR family, contains REC and winged-helix (wHTH) domain [Deinococcus hopiensis KR-140]